MTLCEFLELYFCIIPSYRVQILCELSEKHGELQSPNSFSLERGFINTHSSWKREYEQMAVASSTLQLRSSIQVLVNTTFGIP